MNDEEKFSFGVPKSETDLSAQSESQSPPSSSTTPPSAAPTPSAQASSRPGQWQPPTPEELQDQIPQYKVLGLLGRGGMGAVYQGWQVSLERYVAIKILAPQADDIAEVEFVERFKREARTMAKFQHPGIVSVYNAGQTPSGLLFIVMEYIEGTDVAKMMKAAQGNLAPAHALAITAHVCDALAYAHEHGVIHRDIKPANIMINQEGQVKVADFGLAKAATHETRGLTRASMAMGTPDYIAPEALIAGIVLDQRADLYAVGVMLYQMLTGKVPRGHFEFPSKRVPGVDPRFDGIVLQSMQQDREHRYQSAREIRQDLDVILTTPPDTAEEPQEQQQGPVYQKPVMKLAGRSSRKSGAHVSSAASNAGDFRRAQVESASRKSSSTFVFVLLGAALALGAIFAFTKWSTRSTERSGETSGAVPAPWQPLFTDAEWKQTTPGRREVVDGRVHLLAGETALKSRPTADEAIRARIQFQEGSRSVGFLARLTTEGGCYKAGLNSERSVVLSYFPPGKTSGDTNRRLGEYTLPKPLQPGDTLQLELRLHGDRLTVLVDGTVAIEALDSSVSGPGQWGLIAADGWFESAEMQTLASAKGKSPLLVQATKDAPFVNSLGMKFVPVPIIGGATDNQRVLFSVWETRVQDYEAFATDTKRGCPKPYYEQGPTHPAVQMHWGDATVFCTWLTMRERNAGRIGPKDSYRLPGDHEWTCAAGLADREDPASTPEQKNDGLPDVFAWGSTYPPPAGTGNFNGMETAGKALKDVGESLKEYRDDFPTTAPVGSFPPNRWGLHDLSGNVWERCDDLFRPGSTNRVVRGAAFSDNAAATLKLSCRIGRSPEHRSNFMGFRVVLAISAVSQSPSLPLSPTSADGWQDLLGALTPELVATTGNGWSLEGGELFSPQGNNAVLPLSVGLYGTSYQMRVKLRQLAPRNFFYIALPVGGRMVGFVLDGNYNGYYTGLSQVNGKSGRDILGAVVGKQLKDSNPHDLEVTVRLQGDDATITTTLDARPLYEWTGSIAALSQNPGWRNEPGTLAFGSNTNDWVVSEVKVKRLEK